MAALATDGYREGLPTRVRPWVNATDVSVSEGYTIEPVAAGPSSPIDLCFDMRRAREWLWYMLDMPELARATVIIVPEKPMDHLILEEFLPELDPLALLHGDERLGTATWHKLPPRAVSSGAMAPWFPTGGLPDVPLGGTHARETRGERTKVIPNQGDHLATAPVRRGRPVSTQPPAGPHHTGRRTRQPDSA